MRSDHFAFRVTDLDRAIAFYTEKLGIPLLFQQRDEEHHEAFAFLELEGGNLELLQWFDQSSDHAEYKPSESAPPYTPHIALRTENLDALVEQLRCNTIPILKGPLEISGQVKWLYIADPDHNIVEFVQWL